MSKKARRYSSSFRFLLLTIVGFILIPSAHAEIRRICHVQYETESGLSKKYTVEVTFLTGNELNNKTYSVNYNYLSKYALIWFNNKEVAIIKLDTTAIVGFNFDDFAFKNVFLVSNDVEGSQINTGDGESRRWVITAKNYAIWIDPRER